MAPSPFLLLWQRAISAVFTDAKLLLSFFRVQEGSVSRATDRAKYRWEKISELLERLDSVYVEVSKDPLAPTETVSHLFSEKNLLLLHGAVFDSSFGVLYLNNVGVVESTSWRADKRIRRSAFRLTVRRKIHAGAPLAFVSQRHWNYYHWLIEDLPSLIYLNKTLDNLRICVRADAPRFVHESLSHYGLSHISCKGVVSAERTALVTRGNDTGWPHRWDVDQIRRLETRIELDWPQSKKIYISRRLSSRSPGYEKELEGWLKHHGFQVLFLENMGFASQKNVFAEASIVVAPHGAGLSNLVFSRGGTRVIELFERRKVNQCYERLSAVCGLNYASLITEKEEPSSSVTRRLEKALGTSI